MGTARNTVRPVGGGPVPTPTPALAATLVRATRSRSNAAAALRRLAVDPGATPAERALAAERAALLDRHAC
jgi:hypothetical protein